MCCIGLGYCIIIIYHPVLNKRVSTLDMIRHINSSQMCLFLNKQVRMCMGQYVICLPKLIGNIRTSINEQVYCRNVYVV